MKNEGRKEGMRKEEKKKEEKKKNLVKSKKRINFATQTAR